VIVEPGTFDVEIVEADLGLTNEGKPQLAVAATFIDGPNAGQTLTTYLSFTEKTKQGTLRTLRLLGLQGDDIASDLVQIVGARTKGTVSFEDDREGNPRPRLRIGGGGIALKTVMTIDQRKAFAASLKADLAALRPVPKAGPTATESDASEFF